MPRPWNASNRSPRPPDAPGEKKHAVGKKKRRDTRVAGGGYATVADAAVKYDLSGAFLIEAPTEELEDFLLARCGGLESTQRRRVLSEVDALKRRERLEPRGVSPSDEDSDKDELVTCSSTEGDKAPPPKAAAPRPGLLSRIFGGRRAAPAESEAPSAASSGDEADDAPPPHPDDDDDDDAEGLDHGERHRVVYSEDEESSDDDDDASLEVEANGEAWSRRGHAWLGRYVSRLLWNADGGCRERATGVLVAWCERSAWEVDGEARPLWRAAFEGAGDLVELDKDDVEAGFVEFRRTLEARRRLRHPKQRDSASVRRDRAEARRRDGEVSDDESKKASSASLEASEELERKADAERERKRGRQQKAKKEPRPRKSRSGQRKSNAAAVAALPPMGRRSQGEAPAVAAPPPRPAKPPPSRNESAADDDAGSREERKRRREWAETDAETRKRTTSEQTRAVVDGALAGLNVISIGDAATLAGLNVLTKRGRAHAKQQRERSQLSGCTVPSPRAAAAPSPRPAASRSSSPRAKTPKAGGAAARPAAQRPPPPRLKIPAALGLACAAVVTPETSSSASGRPVRSLSGKRSCGGCARNPCEHTSAGCFLGVEQANGRYLARGDAPNLAGAAPGAPERFTTALEAARRFDMVHKARAKARAAEDGDDVVDDRDRRNFDWRDAAQLAWEKQFLSKQAAKRKDLKRKRDAGDDGAGAAPRPRSPRAAASPRAADGGGIAPPDDEANCGDRLTRDGREWYVAYDEETLEDVAAEHGLEPAKLLAANRKCSHFRSGPPLQLTSKLKHHTRVLLPN